LPPQTPSSVRLRLLLALGSALLLAACTPAPAPVPTPAVTPTPPAIPTPDVRGAFTIDLPRGWERVPVGGDHEALLTDLARVNPVFAESLGARLANLPDTAVEFAFDRSEAAVAAGDLVTLSVTEVDLPPDVALETFARTVQTQVERLVEADVELRRILVTAGKAYSLAYLAPLTRPDGQLATVAVTQVLYTLPGRGYVMTFAVPPARADDYARVVAEIATSFAIGL
jgi:hypothetical protein